MNQEITLPLFSEASKLVKIGGVYQHYKGNLYKVLAVARHSETLEEVVVYQACDGEKNVWVRPLEMFLENTQVNGQMQPRFTYRSSYVGGAAVR